MAVLGRTGGMGHMKREIEYVIVCICPAGSVKLVGNQVVGENNEINNKYQFKK